jgi:hypothetical protein
LDAAAMSGASRGRWSGLGLILGPGCWAINTQASYIVASRPCEAQRALLTPMMLALIAICLIGVAVSVYSMRSIGGEWYDIRGGVASRLLAAIGFGAGLLFALVMADQLAALWIVQSCAR